MFETGFADVCINFLFKSVFAKVMFDKQHTVWQYSMLLREDASFKVQGKSRSVYDAEVYKVKSHCFVC